MTAVVETYHFTREPDPSWVRALEEVSPRSDLHSWLRIVWYAPAQRWVLYEMVPRAFVDPGLAMELNGPRPTYAQYQGGESMTTPLQWDLWRETGCHARPFWVLQGTKGGHKAAYSRDEARLAQMAGLPNEPPSVGDLPYAPFDGRTVKQIVRHNRLKAVRNNLSAFRKAQTADERRREAAEAEKQFRVELVKWLADAVEEPTEHFLRAAKQGDFTAKPTDTDWVKVDEESTARFIETGRV
jgi:hypothetical protein